MRRILLFAFLSILVGKAALLAGTPQAARGFDAAFEAGRTAQSNGQWTLAIQHFREALTVQPHHAQARFLLGMAYRETARYFEARRNFRLAQNANPSDRAWESQCRLQIAACWEASNNYREALAEYRLALSADADSELAKEGQKRTVAQVNGPDGGSK